MSQITRTVLTDPGSEFDRLTELSSRLMADGGRFHPGELVWSRFHQRGHEPDWPTAWWESDGRCVAWGWTELPGDLNLQVDPAVPGLADEVLDWFDHTATGDRRRVEVCDAEPHLVEALHRRGYRRDDTGPFFIHLRRDLADLPEPVVPDGYRLRAVTGEADAAARATVQADAFGTPQRPSRTTAEGYTDLMRRKEYRPGLDWIVETAAGAPVAGVLVWWDPAGRTARVEPVGCHPEHRRRGLAGAASFGALRAVRELGARTATVCARGDDAYPSARALYRSLGFAPYARNLAFVK